jgi:hypothetical protein
LESAKKNSPRCISIIADYLNPILSNTTLPAAQEKCGRWLVKNRLFPD